MGFSEEWAGGLSRLARDLPRTALTRAGGSRSRSVAGVAASASKHIEIHEGYERSPCQPG